MAQDGPKWSRVERYLAGVVSVAVVFALKRNVASLGHDPQLLFLAAVMAAAVFGGLGPGLLATAAGALIQAWYFMAPVASLRVAEFHDQVGVAGFTAEGVVIALLAEALHRARKRATETSRLLGEARAELERRVDQRTAELARAEVAKDAVYEVLGRLAQGCQVVGFDWTYRYLNDTAALQAKRPKEELVGRTMMECFPGIDRTPMFRLLAECMERRTAGSMDNEFDFPDGSKGYFVLSFIPSPEGMCILSTDVTERRRLEEQLRQAQKMEAIGLLAGGVAHDFNNLLSVILSYCDMLALDLDPADPKSGDVEEIRKAGARAADLTRQLLAFSRQQVLQPKTLEVNAVVEGMAKMIRRLVGEDIQLSLRLAPRGMVKCDPGQLEQVIMNLVVNARDAMPDGGKLAIEVDDVTLDAAYVKAHPGSAAGRHVLLAVRDSGVGMDAATQSRIFEPFFTTKGVGKGTGLGLSTVYGIVQQSGGSIAIDSRPGKGSVFEVYLPWSDEPADVATPAPVMAPHPNTETVLLVEDEGQVRGLLVAILERAGYRVLVSAGADEAIEVSRKVPGAIDLLLTDLVMPGLNGRELAKRLAAKRPATKVIFMSGYTGEAIGRHGVFEAGVAFVQKPITPAALLARVRDVLDAPGFTLSAGDGEAREPAPPPP